MAPRASRRVHIFGLSRVRGRRADRTSFGNNPPGGGKQGDAAQHRTQAAGVQDVCPSAALHNASLPVIGESLAASRAKDKKVLARRLHETFLPCDRVSQPML